MRIIRHIMLRIAIAGLPLAVVACEDQPPPPQLQAESPQPAPPSLWQDGPRSPIVAIDESADDPEMVEAMKAARASAEDARKRWSLATSEQRARWAIKWAAPTADGRTEHVWVSPVRWSKFRIEGVLTSEPVNELANGKSLGDLVSFPIDELSDWIFLKTDDFTGPREGGFTVNVLEKRYGTPSASPANDDSRSS